MLALTATDTDATNQSYYGEQKLSFLSADGTNDGLVQLKVLSYIQSCPGFIYDLFLRIAH